MRKRNLISPYGDRKGEEMITRKKMEASKLLVWSRYACVNDVHTNRLTEKVEMTPKRSKKKPEPR